MHHHEDNLLADIAAGALAGVAATFVLDRIDWFMWNRQPAEARARTVAARPYGKDPAHVLVEHASERFGVTMSERQNKKAGDVVHWLIGIAPGLVYGALRPRAPFIGAGGGAVFGVGLFSSQDEGLNTLLKLGGKPSDYPWQDHARGLIAHAVYGLTLDFTFGQLRGGR